MRVAADHGCESRGSPKCFDDGRETVPARSRPYIRPVLAAAVFFAIFVGFSAARSASADEFDTAADQFRTGDYAAALKAAEAATKPHYAEARWWQLRLECLKTLGRYTDGAKAFELSQRQHPTDAPIRVTAYDLLHSPADPGRRKRCSPS
ncbi:MAG: hypothetical protein QM775_08525 [Pirellulales bacterium]